MGATLAPIYMVYFLLQNTYYALKIIFKSKLYLLGQCKARPLKDASSLFFVFYFLFFVFSFSAPTDKSFSVFGSEPMDLEVA